LTQKTLDTALDLLKYFSKEKQVWGVRELAKEMDMSHSIAYRILTTYEKHGFVKQNALTKKYELGFRFWEYGLIVKENLKLSDVISPIMERLSTKTEESIFLTWLDGMEAICLEVIESSQNIKFAVSVGSRTPLHAGASNKVIMAYLPEETQMAIIQRGLDTLTEKTMTDPGTLLHSLQLIRNQGWCYTVGEFDHDVAGIAVPLFNSQGGVLGSLTVAGPKYRLSEEKIDSVLLLLQKSTQEVQRFISKLDLNDSVLRKTI
jgi:DNA-binding IclR family transcriptional regulator